LVAFLWQPFGAPAPQVSFSRSFQIEFDSSVKFQLVAKLLTFFSE